MDNIEPGDGYEVQILDSYDNRTYSNGQAGSIYKQHIPLVNASKKPGEWQTYDIIFKAPVFNENGEVKSPAYITIFHNGVLIQNNSEIKVSEDDYKNDPRVIKSPMVGTVYLQPEPGANKFVNIGDSVKSGQTILIIEAMKTMNPIESSLQGKVIKVLVENEQAVEFGQPLVLIG